MFRVRSVIFLASLHIVKSAAAADESDADDDKTLKDALLLIKLIRTGTALNMSSLAELLSSTYDSLSVPLSAPALPEPPLDVSPFNMFDPILEAYQPVQNVIQPEQSAFQPIQNTFSPKQSGFQLIQNTKQPIRKTFQPVQNLQRRKMLRGNRRKISNSNANNGNKRKMSNRAVNNGNKRKLPLNPVINGYYRRMDYEDPFGPHPNHTTTLAAPQTTTAATSTTTTTTTATAPTTALNSASEVTTPIPASQSLETTDDGITLTEPHSGSKAKLKKLSYVNSSAGENTTAESSKDPVTSQVQAELENELKKVAPSDNKKGAAKALFKFTKPGAGRATGNSTETKGLSTLRIHLKTSSRYPLPLPENHSFCFFNPENGLCRTPI